MNDTTTGNPSERVDVTNFVTTGARLAHLDHTVTDLLRQFDELLDGDLDAGEVHHLSDAADRLATAMDAAFERHVQRRLALMEARSPIRQCSCGWYLRPQAITCPICTTAQGGAS